MEALGRERTTTPTRRWRRVLESPHIQQVSAMCVLFLVPLLLLVRVHAQPGDMDWQHLSSWPVSEGAQEVIARSLDRSTAIYAVSSAGELYWSGNEGQRWFRMSEGLQRATLEQRSIIDLAVDPEDAKIIHTVIGSTFTFAQPMVYWTVDMGLNWQPRASLGQERVRAITYGPARDDLFVVTSTDVLKAMVLEGRSNATEALQESFGRNQDSLYWVSIAPFDADTWVTDFAASRLPRDVFSQLAPIGGPVVMQSTAENAGQGKQAMVLYIGTQEKGLQIIVHTELGTFRPSDTAQDAASLYVLTKATIYTIHVDPKEPLRLYVGTDKGLYTSEDGGRHWSALGQAHLGGAVLAFLSDERSRDRMYVGTSKNGVWYSEDGGRTFRELGYGIRRAHVYALAMSQTDGSRILYAGTRSGLWTIAPPD